MSAQEKHLGSGRTPLEHIIISQGHVFEVTRTNKRASARYLSWGMCTCDLETQGPIARVEEVEHELADRWDITGY